MRFSEAISSKLQEALRRGQLVLLEELHVLVTRCHFMVGENKQNYT